MSQRGKLVFVCLMLVIAGAWCRTRRVAAAQLAPLPLQGEAAIQQLKTDGGYASLAAAMTAAHHQVNAAPDQAGALITQQRKLTVADGAAGDQFGTAIAVSGDTAIIGAPFDDVVGVNQGSAYVFIRNGRNGADWSLQQKLVAPNNAAGELFGRAVAIDGDTVVVGAPTHNNGPRVAEGYAIVFVRSAGVWTGQVTLRPTDGAAGDFFGSSVALNGDTAVVGAPNHAIGANAGQGAAYVIIRTNGQWAHQQMLVASDGAASDNFGASVAVSGDTVAVGANSDDIGANANQGSAYVFSRGGTLWTQQQKLTASDGGANDFFGLSIALGGDTVVVGAPFNLIGANSSQGAAYVFTRSGPPGNVAWTQQQELTASDGATGDAFGFSVALSGDLLAVGAFGKSMDAQANQGAAYIFGRSGAAWTQQRRLLSEDGAAQDRFGFAVALSGETVLAGALFDGIGVNPDQGSAYVFSVCANNLVQQQRITANDGAVNDAFGRALVLSGDTAVVGAPFDASGANAQQGSAYVFVRSGGVWTEQQKLTASDGAVGDLFGFALALNGDTLVVSAFSDDIGAKPDQGSAYVFVRNNGNWVQRQKLTASDGAAGDVFGFAVALSSDTLVVGAALDATGANAQQGSVYVFNRSGADWKENQKLFANDGTANDEFGSSLALSGNTLVVGAPLDRSGVNTKQGSAYVFARENGAWAQQQKLSPNDNVFIGFGFSVALSGDTLAVGVMDDNSDTPGSQASVYVFTRKDTQPSQTPQTWTQQQKLITNDGAFHNFFGTSVALSGDTLVVGAAFDGVGAQANQGAAYVFTRGGPPGNVVWTLHQRLTASDGAGGDEFGTSVALSGDTVVVGAFADTIGANARQGSAYVFICPACPTVTLNPDMLPGGVIGTTYNQIVTAVTAFAAGSGAEPFQFSFSGGALPPGLTLAQNGQLTGTPTLAGTFGFTITATNLSSLCTGSRAYTLTIGAQPVCDAEVEPTQQAFLADGGSGAINVNSPAACAWTALSNAPWLVITSGARGTGNGEVRFTVAANTSAARRGTLAVAGRTVTITQTAPLAVVSAASFVPGSLAGESIVAAFGLKLAPATAAAATQPLPTTLGGASVSVRDSTGAERFAPLFFVSPGQINFLMPPDTALGQALATVIVNGAPAAAVNAQIVRAAPGLFAANANGQGVATGVVLRVRADGAQSFEPLVRFDAGTGRFVAAPLNLGPASDRVFLVLFGTGLRNRTSAEAVNVNLGGVHAEVLFAGPQGAFVGLDQLNVAVPRSLAGRGEIDLAIVVDGKPANTLRVAIQ